MITVFGIVLLVAMQRKIRQVLLLTYLRQVAFWLAVGLCIGILWAASLGQRYQYWQQLNGEIQQDVTIEGRIAGISYNERSARLTVDHLTVNGVEWPRKLKAIIYYYEPTKVFRLSQYVTADVRIKPARAVANPAGFDTQKWYVSQQIVRTGYILNDRILLLKPALTLRSRLQEKLLSLNIRGEKWLNALMFGDRNGFSQSDWTLLRETGTSHLFAISGLHLVLAGGVVSIVVQGLSLLFKRGSLKLANILPVQWWCLLAGSTAYAYCANWQISVTRAYIVMCLWICLWWCARRLGRWLIFMLTATLCLLIHPEATYGMALYLSLGAVAVIMIVHWRWYSWFTSSVSAWRKLIVMQMFMSAGLVPLTLSMFQSVSWTSPLVNIFFIPVMSFIVVPACIVGLILLLCSQADSSWLVLYLDATGHAIDTSLIFMSWFQSVLTTFSGSALLSASERAIWTVFVILVLVFLLPFKGRKRFAACFVFIGGIFSLVNLTNRNDWEIHYFDVGQGSASMVTRNGRAVVVDTGASFNGTSSYADQVLLPFLLQKGLTLDALIVSHFDNDHAGGVVSIKQAFPNIDLISPETGCHAGQKWRWQALWFEVLWPPAAHDETYSENNLSCVVRVTDSVFSALFPGDIEAEAEARLVSIFAPNSSNSALYADILLAPHHGSRTSSTQVFVDAVSPSLALFSQGWLNRWSFPNQDVVKRYREQGADTVEMSRSGYVKVTVGDSMIVHQYRHSGPWYQKSF